MSENIRANGRNEEDAKEKLISSGLNKEFVNRFIEETAEEKL